ncbi:MAG: hypothetical protein QOD30_268 [Actinomycetota bacterium]|nr:hypothetical protein [Actinomycetota bacterium]
MSAPCVVHVSSTRPPAITWPCPRCRSTVFDCSERFRANCNGKLVDIWLIYRCRRCESTKNITIVERRPVSKVPRDLLHAAQDNDAVAARGLARDVGLLRSNGMAVAEGDEWEVDRTAGLPLQLVFPEPLLVRLDHVAAAALDVPRSRLPIDVDRRLRLHAGPLVLA